MRDQWVESGEVFDQIYDAAELYGIFDDLFQHAHFWPCLMLQVFGLILVTFSYFLIPRLSGFRRMARLWCRSIGVILSNLESAQKPQR